MITRSRAAAVLAALTVLTACGGSDDGGSGGSGGGEKSGPGDQLTAGQLSTVLLSAEDLPAGYRVDTSPDEEDEDQDFGDSECAKELEELDDEDDAAAKVERTFDKGKDGLVSLEQSVESYADEDALAADFSATRKAIGACKQITFTTEGMPVTLTVSDLDVPERGDDTIGFRMKGQVSGFPIELLFGIHRLGHNVVGVFSGGLGEASVETLEGALEKSFDRLTKAHTTDPSATPAAAAAASPTIRTGGPGTYVGQSQSGVEVTLVLPATAKDDPLAGRVDAYLNSVKGFEDTTLALLTLRNGSQESISAGDVTVVLASGDQLELGDLVGVLNDTDDADPDAYSRAGSDLNDEVSQRSLSDLKPGARGSRLIGVDKPLDGIQSVYVDVDGEELQLSLK